MAEKNTGSNLDFGIAKTVRHGFPEKPSCMAYDSVQDLLAFGSLSGEVVILGRPGLEIRFETHSEVLQIQFSINKGLIVAYCGDQKCYLWSIKTSTPSLLSEFRLPSKEKLTVLYWPYNSNTVYIGTDNGNVLFAVVELTEIDDSVITADMLSCEDTLYWNKVTLPSHGFRRDNPGEVKSIEEHPLEPEKVLIGYSYGLCVVWNLKIKEVEYRKQHANLESVAWYGGYGKTYVTCSSEGQIAKVVLKKGEEKMLYQCPDIGSITNLQSYNIKQDKWLLFIQCTTKKNSMAAETQVVIMGEKDVLTSIEFDQPVVDILCVPSSPFKAERQSPKALVVLQDKKLAVFDLQCNLPSQRPLPFCVPFSFDILSSPITFLHIGGQCSSHLMVDQLMVLKSKFRYRDKCLEFSSNKWPFEGGMTWRKELRNSTLPELLITSQIDKNDSITIWLCYPDILEKMFTIETAQLFPPDYSYVSRDQPSSKQEETTDEPKSKGAAKVDWGRELDVKFVTVDMKEENIVFVNHRGNVLVYKFGLQPAHENPRSVEILLNAIEEVDSEEPEDKSSQLSWRFCVGHSNGSTPCIHLLYHAYCVVNWEHSVKVAPVESAVYNHNIKMLLLGTHIAMVLADMENNGTIVIDTLKTLKSLGLSTITSCETRTIVETKKKSGFLAKLTGKKVAEKMPVPHDASPCCSSVVDIVFFTTKIKDQPYLTVWMGTESGELAVYKVLRNPANIKEIQMKSADVMFKQKDPVVSLIFLDKDLEIIHSNACWGYSLPQSEEIPSDDESVILNYVVVQTKKNVECYGFPSKKIVPIGKIKEDKGDEILRSFFTKCEGSPYLLSIISQEKLLVSSFPDLDPITTLSLTSSLMDLSAIPTLTFTDKARGMYVSRVTEIQRIAISLCHHEDDEVDGAVSTDSCPSPYVPHRGPLKPDIKTGFKIKKTPLSHDTCDRNSWFTPQKTFQTRERGERRIGSIPSSGKIIDRSNKGSATLPVTGRTGDQKNPYERTAQALKERGERLNNIVKTTGRLSELAEMYADNTAPYGRKQ